MSGPTPRPPLTPEQRKLAERNVRYGFNEAYTFLRRFPHLRRLEDDIVSAALEGVAWAAQDFDPTLGFTFPTFAVSRIRERIQWTCGRLKFAIVRSHNYFGPEGEGVGEEALRHMGEEGHDDTERDAQKLWALATERLLKERRLRQTDGNARVTPEESVECFIRYRFRGEKLREIGADLGISAEAVRQQALRCDAPFRRVARSFRNEAA